MLYEVITQQLAVTARVGDDVGAGGDQRSEVRTDQPGFAVLEYDV